MGIGLGNAEAPIPSITIDISPFSGAQLARADKQHGGELQSTQDGERPGEARDGPQQLACLFGIGDGSEVLFYRLGQWADQVPGRGGLAQSLLDAVPERPANLAAQSLT